MAQLISTAILIAAALASFSLALILARLGLAAMFRILPAARHFRRPLSRDVGATGRSPM